MFAAWMLVVGVIGLVFCIIWALLEAALEHEVQLFNEEAHRFLELWEKAWRRS